MFLLKTKQVQNRYLKESHYDDFTKIVDSPL